MGKSSVCFAEREWEDVACRPGINLLGPLCLLRLVDVVLYGESCCLLTLMCAGGAHQLLKMTLRS